jgi:hypothetical protein
MLLLGFSCLASKTDFYAQVSSVHFPKNTNIDLSLTAEGEKIFTSHSSDRGLMSGLYKELKNIATKEQVI